MQYFLIKIYLSVKITLLINTKGDKMIEILSIIFIIFLCVSFYINENMIHKNKIEFDLLQDREIKEKK